MTRDELDAMLDRLIDAAKKAVRAKTFDDWEAAEKRLQDLKRAIIIIGIDGKLDGDK